MENISPEKPHEILEIRSDLDKIIKELVKINEYLGKYIKKLEK